MKIAVRFRVAGEPSAGTRPMSSDYRPRPLGVRADVALTDAQLRTLQALQDFDLSPVRGRLLREAVMPSGWVDEALLEFRRYLGLRVLYSDPIDMFSKQVDDVWHTCLLYWRLYAAYCDAAFGQFVHHEPAAGHDAASPYEAAPARPDRETRWSVFQEAYERMYGDLGRLWRMAGPTRP